MPTIFLMSVTFKYPRLFKKPSSFPVNYRRKRWEDSMAQRGDLHFEKLVSLLNISLHFFLAEISDYVPVINVLIYRLFLRNSR